MRRVVENLGLADNPAFNGEGRLAQITRHVRELLQGDSPDLTTPEREQRAINAERALSGGLSVETDNRSYLISVTFTATRPGFAATVANAVAEAYLAQRMETNLAAAGRTADWLGGQVEATEAQLRTADAAVAAFRRKAGLLELGGQGETLRQIELREYGTQLNTLTAARTADEARLTRITSLMHADISGAANELQGQAAVQAAAQRAQAARRALSELQSRFGPKHPSVQQATATLADAEASLADEVERAVAALRAALAASQQTERDMRAKLEAMQVAAINDATQGAQLRNLQAMASTLRERLASLVRSRDQALALRDLRVVPASLIVPAQAARQPAGLNPMVIGFAGFLGGAVLGLVLAVLLERLDRGFRTSDDVVAGTDLRCLGLTPELSPGDMKAVVSNLPSGSPGLVMFEESVRLVASSIGLFANATADRGRIVLVTSAFAGEGRSGLCAGMARTLAMSGRRVLLIDGPPRRFGTPPIVDHGAADTAGALVGDSTPTPLPGSSDDGALVVLHRGSGSGLSVDVFASSRLASALEQARKHFDVILVEGPPVMLVADALVLGRMADNVVHVAKWADTRRRSVRAALRRMQDHGVVVDGVVLSRVDVRRHARLGLADQAALHLRPQEYYRAATTPPWRGAGPTRPGTASANPQSANSTSANSASESHA